MILIIALVMTIVASVAPVGLAIAIPLGEVIGVRWLFVALGFAGATIALLSFLSPAIRSMETRHFNG
jgi:MFS transporter, DHA3 family, macrolide efflux protein